MKTSNKLLIGFFSIIVVCMIIANIVIKNKIEKLPVKSQKTEIIMPTDTLSVDSIAMDDAIENE